jgi:hypothetical protein
MVLGVNQIHFIHFQVRILTFFQGIIYFPFFTKYILKDPDNVDMFYSLYKFPACGIIPNKLYQQQHVAVNVLGHL